MSTRTVKNLTSWYICTLKNSDFIKNSKISLDTCLEWLHLLQTEEVVNSRTIDLYISVEVLKYITREYLILEREEKYDYITETYKKRSIDYSINVDYSLSVDSTIYNVERVKLYLSKLDSYWENELTRDILTAILNNMNDIIRINPNRKDLLKISSKRKSCLYTNLDEYIEDLKEFYIKK